MEEAEDCAPVNGEGVSEVLYAKFKAHFPDVTIGRPDHFYSTASRIIAPTRPSLRGPCKMSDEDLVAYKSKKWVPRIRKGIKSCMIDDLKYVNGLDYSLNATPTDDRKSEWHIP